MKKKIKNKLFYVVIFLLVALWFTPIFNIILTSLKSPQDYYSGQGLFELPEKIHWKNFIDAILVGNLFQYMKNGLMISFLKVPIGILVEALAAFAITRLPIKFKTGIFIYFIVGMMLPGQIALVPINIMYNTFDLHDTYFGLFYAYVAFGTGFGILVLRGFFNTIPRELDDAARIDGCNRWMLFTKIILPIAKPALATLFIIDFLGTWNEYLLSSVIIYDSKMKTVPTGLMNYVGEHTTDYGMMAAGVLITIIPVLLVFLLFQRYLVEGMSGAVK